MEVDLKNKKPDIRYLNDMREVVYDKEWLKTAPNLELYYMYRKVKIKNGLRYSITVIPPRLLGKEFVKTKGHEHFNYGEIYIVLEGKAIFLIQKRRNKNIEDVCAVKAKKGEAVVIPVHYGHTTINPSKKTLKTGDWAVENCKNEYKPYERLAGACYYYTKKGWIKNKNYKKIPKLRFEKPLERMPRNLDFLKE